MSAWEKVPPEVISKCFKHGMYPDKEIEMDDDSFAGKLLEIEEVLSRVSPDLVV